MVGGGRSCAVEEVNVLDVAMPPSDGGWGELMTGDGGWANTVTSHQKMQLPLEDAASVVSLATSPAFHLFLASSL